MRPADAGVLELFAGLGSVAQGFADTGHFAVAGLTDIDSEARRTVAANVADVPYLQGDIRELNVDQLIDSAAHPIVGVLGCPPCQGFSAAGRRDDEDERNQLLVTFFDRVLALDPMFFVMENVPAVLWKPNFLESMSRVSARYATWSGVLNAALYGLPQTRQRAIVIGYRHDLAVQPTPPPASHAGSRKVFDYRTGKLVAPSIDTLAGLLGHYPIIGVPKEQTAAARHLPTSGLAQLVDFVTVSEALGDLTAGYGDAYSGDDPSAYARTLRGDATVVSNHEGWVHKPEMVARLADVPQGGVPGAPNGRNRTYFSQAYGRLHSAGLARTVTTNFHNPGSGRFTHHTADRALSIREAARLQGVPDSFKFSGHMHVQERLIGNAFPRPWAKAIGEHVQSQLADALQ